MHRWWMLVACLEIAAYGRWNDENNGLPLDGLNMEGVEPMSDMVKNMIFKTRGKKNMRFLKWGKLESKQNWSKLKQSFDSSCKMMLEGCLLGIGPWYSGCLCKGTCFGRWEKWRFLYLPNRQMNQDTLQTVWHRTKILFRLCGIILKCGWDWG